jgi:nicotinamidase/pyrazinamidase
MDEAYVFEGGLSVVAGVESRESVQKARYAAATALLVVDVQNDFADPTGALAVPGGAGVVPIANREMSAALRSGATVVLTQDWHPAVTPHFLTGGGRWPVHCVGGTRGAELHPDLEVPEEAIRVRKGTGAMDGYSAFAERDPRSSAVRSTGLDRELRARGITEVVIVGLATDYCVLQTALDAVLLGFDTRVLAEGVRAVEVEPGDGEKALLEMRGAGIRLS